MNYLDYFHFDNYPFPTDNTYNYFYRRNKVLKIANDIANTCRFYSGVYVITGSEGCGKTVLLQKFVDTVKNNDAVFEIRANNNTDILKVLAENLDVKEAKNIENIFHSLNLIYEKGKNIIIVIDDAQNLSKEQLINLNALIDTVSYLRVVVCGNTKLKKIISGKIFHELRERIVKKYKLCHLSFFEGMKYISNISTSALALSQYKKVISFPALILLSFVSNRNIHNINKITDIRDLWKFLRLFNNEKVVCLGEIGLDYYWVKDLEERERQKEMFIYQLGLAKDKNLPTSIHIREATQDALDILKEHAKTPFVLHCFNASEEILNEYLKLNCYFAIGGVVTFKNATNLQEVVKKIPLDRLLIETDAPYLSPVPYRGKLNEPKYIKETLQFIADLRGMSFEELDKITTENAKKVFLNGK